MSAVKTLPVTRSLLKTLRLLSTPINAIFKPIDIVKALKNRKQVINRQQQDAQELYQLLVSQLDDEMDKIKQDTSVVNPLNGQLDYHIKCTECGYSVSINITY
jgi:ubiquitin carboxyl-terminal hydrolase 1